MHFKKFMLNDYLCSKSGEDMSETFANLKQLWEDHRLAEAKRKSKFSQFVTGFLNGPGYIEDSFDNPPLPLEFDDKVYSSLDEFVDDNRFAEEDTDLAQPLQSMIPYLSLQLFFRCPEYAFPYLLPRHYYKLEIICREFGIELPRLPAHGEHLKRVNYYFEICKAMYDFRLKSNLSPLELCVFFYGFAMRFCDEAVNESIHRANQVYLLYANPEDSKSFLRQGLDPSDVTVWQGNPNMQPGDIVLMYEQAPRSCFSCVWRTVSPGFDDPFAWYPGSVFIGEPVKIPDLTFREISQNPVWRTNPLVNAHMQGGSKRVCTIDCYKAVLDMVKAKDPAFDLAALPPPPKDYKYDEMGLNVEHDVELKLLEPFLRNLGFTEEDWVKQFSIRIGRENASRPDYVIHLEKSGPTAKAAFVFEAKLSIPTKRQLKKDFGQAMAYGRLLLCKIICLVAREGVWLSSFDDDFTFDKLRYFDWDKLKEPETLAQLRTLFSK